MVVLNLQPFGIKSADAVFDGKQLLKIKQSQRARL